jgi:hypothetical protein
VKVNSHAPKAQKDHHYDMQGHADKARQLLAQVNQELKAATNAAN